MAEDSDRKKTLGGRFKGSQWGIFVALALAALLVYIWGPLYSVPDEIRHPITYTQFDTQLEASNISEVRIHGHSVNGRFIEPVRVKPPGAVAEVEAKGFRTELPAFQGEGLMARLREHGVEVTVESTEGGGAWQMLIVVLPWVLIIGIWILIMRRSERMQGGPGGLVSFSSSKAKLFDATRPGVTFADVAGMENVKRELAETIEFMKDPARFHEIGAKVPKGVLLIGPPGTGKTLLARATAGEAGVKFFSISASEFIEMFVGVGAARVRDTFKKARESHPSIIFIDELDAVGRTRGTGLGGGHDEREQTLNQLLSEMDGFEPHEEVIVMSATNRPDVLDPALLRPGRFDRHIIIDRPGLKERLGILEVHSRNKKLEPDVDLERIARGTPGMTGADLENLLNEAALMAARKGKKTIAADDLENARDRVLMGAEREEVISDKEKRITAYHESGHALVAHNLPDMDPLHKVTIIPRGMAMGVTQMLPEEDRHYYPKSYLTDRLTVALGGRAAEKLVFGDTSTGAQSDLKEATGLAEKMVSQWGMSAEVGPINLGRGEEHPFLGLELAQPRRYSERMAWLMDQDIRKFIIEAEERAEEILAADRASLDALAKALIENESLDREEIERIIRESRGE